ncbi:hypothetical protein KsCSTR_49480 [Candidatus Kuenenia stuttgartiensis]|uniref:Uncharacterized protein n=1 Tax=Kuenenia stuttgartiensis TaxID=174633 RepID=Q1PVF9_KUEST|nr:hypothetical protein KsCSTR_49480 [Candidatus Kuenenia stuttgartiensis]CAJ71204.1 unknown protein [Candidatus Kuenenia stuttgartiensis]
MYTSSENERNYPDRVWNPVRVNTPCLQILCCFIWCFKRVGWIKRQRIHLSILIIVGFGAKKPRLNPSYCLTDFTHTT